MHVEADLHEARHDLLNLFLSRAFLHHHYHAATLQGETPLLPSSTWIPARAGSSRLFCRADALPHTRFSRLKRCAALSAGLTRGPRCVRSDAYIAPLPRDGP